jgi:hypothetical protein
MWTLGSGQSTLLEIALCSASRRRGTLGNGIPSTFEPNMTSLLNPRERKMMAVGRLNDAQSGIKDDGRYRRETENPFQAHCVVLFELHCH